MFFILERTLDTQGGAPPYSFVCTKKSVSEAQEWIDYQLAHYSGPSGWTPHYIITKLVV